MITLKEVNSYANTISKRIKKGEKIEDIIENYDETGDNDCTIYDVFLGKYDGRVTKKHIGEDAKEFGCKRIEIKDAILSLIVNHNDNSIDILLSVEVDWLDKYDNWHFREFPTIKEYDKIIIQ